MKVFVVDAPSAILYSEIFVLFLEILDTTDQVLFDCRDNSLKSIHLSLNNTVHIIDMFQSGFFEVQKSLFSICNLLLYDTLTTKHIALYFFECLVLGADLLADDCSLVCQIDISLFLGSFDDLIHSVETVLDLLHEAALALKPLPLIILHLVK